MQMAWEADVIEIVLWICFIAGVLYGLDTLLLWMEAKGWLYYRKVKRKSSGIADVFIVGDAFNPGARHMGEARQERAGEEDEDDGEDEGQRKPEDRVA